MVPWFVSVGCKLAAVAICRGVCACVCVFACLLACLLDSVQRVYVNLVSTLDLSHIARIQRGNLGCKIEHKYILNECGCIDKGNATQLAQLDVNIHAMNAALHALASKWRVQLAAAGRHDMAVVLQPFMEGVGADLDLSFLNKLDCFHPSARGHEVCTPVPVQMWQGVSPVPVQMWQG